jgi:hypothetical protein
LQRLAYCSLASSVVQVCSSKQQLGASFAGQLLGLASQLVQVAGQGAASSSSGSSSRVRNWHLAASLAAAVAAGAYAAHTGGAGEQTDTRGPTDAAAATVTTTTGSSATAAAGMGASAKEEGAQSCPAGCSVCGSATQLYLTLCCLEHGAAVPPEADTARAAALAAAAQQRAFCLTLQQKLLALAWRHPVPYVCGNVLCERLEGPSAAGAVRNRVGTLCGGCRAAWYCCERCQRAAWDAHRQVCRVTR